ncbi:MAG: GIY-YIG nuclease family protein [Alistipes sp.]|nr:GIY-YIG nuclease family protein [Alistipes sp.]MBQ5637887.1 GIY-YIG nuclease family protein [Alistipes sp.]
MQRSWVYIISNATRSTLYIGVTNDLRRRMREHKNGEGSLFARRYRCYDLLYYEEWPDIRQAIEREKQLKGWLRSRKEELIKRLNPELVDLSNEFSERSF